MKDNSNQSIRIGDTLRKWSEPDTPPLEGFAPTKSMCFGGIFPSSADEYPQLKKAVEKLVLNDSSVVVHREASQALGPGFRSVFLNHHLSSSWLLAGLSDFFLFEFEFFKLQKVRVSRALTHGGLSAAS